MQNEPETVFFISSTFKGGTMLRAVKEMGCYVLLLTEESLRDNPWPMDVIDEIFFTPDLAQYRDVTHTVSYLNRGRHIHCIVPLDEFEVEIAAMLREHLRIPGTGVTQTRRFRDKLVMREVADAAGIPVPPFVSVKNYDDLRAYMDRVAAPWVLKPRSEASAMGIRKIEEPEQLWRALDDLGDNQSYYLLEQFLPGSVYHVDSIIVDGEVVFVTPQMYGAPPMQVYQGGGVFTSRVLRPDSDDATTLRAINERVIHTLGMQNGVAHTEFIKAHADGNFYFLESAARVGGAHLSDLIAQATGIDLWEEWGRLEVAAMRSETYTLPEVKRQGGGLLMTLAKQQHPDLSAYDDAEVVWKADKAYHAGLIVVSDNFDRVDALLDSYSGRFAQDFMTSADPWGPQRTGTN